MVMVDKKVDVNCKYLMGGELSLLHESLRYMPIHHTDLHALTVQPCYIKDELLSALVWSIISSLTLHIKYIKIHFHYSSLFLHSQSER